MRRRCSSRPTTTCSACSTARASALEDLGIPRERDGGPGRAAMRARSGGLSPRTTTLFRGTPTRMWLDHAFATVFGIDERLTPESADRVFDRINDCLARPEFRPRALFERFNIEVLATTESPLDPLAHHAKIRASGWKGRVDHRVPARSGRRSGVRRLSRQCAALGALDRREHGDVARLSRRASESPRVLQDDGRDVDRPRPSRRARPATLPEAQCQQLLDRALAGTRRRRTKPSCSAARC